LIQKDPEEGGIIAGDDVSVDIVDGKLGFSIQSRTVRQNNQIELVDSKGQKAAEHGVYDEHRIIVTFKIRKS